MMHEGFRIPDKVFWILTGIIVVFTWTAVAIVYPLLPHLIPVHFSIAGQADAWSQKSWWTVFFPPLIQTALVALFAWMYRYPHYANIPTSLTIVLLPEPWRTKIMTVLKHMIVMLTVIVSLILAYVAEAMVISALGLPVGITPWALAGLVGLLLVLIIVYAIWLVRWTKQGIAAAQTATKK